MSAPRLPEVERVTDELFADLQGEHSGVWQILGDPMAGKSTVLTELSNRLEKDAIPILVSPAQASLDAGPSALVQVADNMKQAGLLNGEAEALTEGDRPWAEKLERVQRWLDQHQTDVVLLCDEPDAWAAYQLDSERFAAPARDVVRLLLERTAVRRVATGPVPDSVRLKREAFRLHPRSDPYEWLTESDNWDELSGAAQELSESDRIDLAKYSPLQIRLLVSHIALSSLKTVAGWLPEDDSRRAISRRFARILAERSELSDLCKTWQRLALARRPIPEALLNDLGGASLRDLAGAVLRHGLLYSRGDNWILHETLRRDAREFWTENADAPPESRLNPASVREAHATLSDFYRRRFREAHLQSGDDATALDEEMEAFHHTSVSGQPDPELRAFFVEQLDALGKFLSQDRHDYVGAAGVFRRALNWDEDDDYAHHYLAYNLDRLAADRGEVEEHYVRAIHLNERHPWWHARYIIFLVVTGRTDDAWRAWNEALDFLSEGDSDLSPTTYERMHLWVAKTLLRRGQLRFAESVLRDVPSQITSQSPGLAAARRRLDALREAERHGAFRPGPELEDGWWRRPPRLLPLALPGEKPIRRWLAARVTATEDEGLTVRVAEVVPGRDSRPEAATSSVSFEEFNSWQPDVKAEDLQPGRFLEIGLYATGKRRKAEMVARAFPVEAWDDGALDAPDTSRYLKKSEFEQTV